MCVCFYISLPFNWNKNRWISVCTFSLPPTRIQIYHSSLCFRSRSRLNSHSRIAAHSGIWVVYLRNELIQFGSHKNGGTLSIVYWLLLKLLFDHFEFLFVIRLEIHFWLFANICRFGSEFDLSRERVWVARAMTLINHHHVRPAFRLVDEERKKPLRK